MTVVDETTPIANQGAKYAKGMEGKEEFLIWDHKKVEALALQEGPELGARYIRFGNGEIGYGVLKVEEHAVSQGREGFMGIGRKSPTYDRTTRFIKRAEPTPPPPPSPQQLVEEGISAMQKQADGLVENVKSLGKKKHQAQKTAEDAQAKAKEYLNNAREFIKSGDQDNAVNALYKVVAQSVRGDEYANIAQVVAQEQSALMQQVAAFRTGLEQIQTRAELQGVKLDAARSMNEVKKQMTGLGGEASTLKDQLAKMDQDLADLQAENSAMDEMIENGEVDSLFGDPLTAKAKKSSADDAVAKLLSQLMSENQTATTEAAVATGAIGATQAAEEAATTAKVATM
jgi:phage shock protein A